MHFELHKLPRSMSRPVFRGLLFVVECPEQSHKRVLLEIVGPNAKLPFVGETSL